MRVERLEGGEPSVKCQRCPRHLREIWCLSVDATDDELAAHNIARDWRVGNECGPQLIQATAIRWHGAPDDSTARAALWKRRTSEVGSRLRLLSRLEQVVAAAASTGVELSISSELSERREELLTGTLRPHRKRRLQGLVTRHGRALGLWK